MTQKNTPCVKMLFLSKHLKIRHEKKFQLSKKWCTNYAIFHYDINIGYGHFQATHKIIWQKLWQSEYIFGNKFVTFLMFGLRLEKFIFLSIFYSSSDRWLQQQSDANVVQNLQLHDVSSQVFASCLRPGANSSDSVCFDKQLFW